VDRCLQAGGILAGQNAELTAQLQESAAANAAQRAANVEPLVSSAPISPSNTNTAACHY